jgi:RNA recognition motif-containing protein
MPGKHHFAFVDLETSSDAARAVKELNGADWGGEQLKVNIASGLPKKIEQRGQMWRRDAAEA